MNSLLRFFLSALTAVFLLSFNASAQDIHFDLVKRAQDDIGTVIIAMVQDSKGFLWFATQNGLYKYDGFQYTAYHNQPGNPNSLVLENIECLAEDKNGYIWVGHYHNDAGLERLDPATGIFTHFRHKNDDSLSLVNDSITVIRPESDGTMWIGTNGGLDHFDTKTNRFIHYRHSASDPGSISCNQVRVVYEDKQGTVWVGTGNPFIFENRRKEGGLNKFNKQTGKFTRFLHNDKDPNSLVDDRVRAILEDSRGNFWVGSAGDGLHLMDRSKGTFQRLLYDPAHPEKLSRPPVQRTLGFAADHITFLLEDNKGRIWIGTFEGGINVYDPVTQKISYYGTGPNSKEKIQDGNFWNAYKTKEGIIWIASWGNNLYKINPYQVKVKVTDLGKSVLVLAEDKAKTLWLGTNQGLMSQDSNGKTETFLIDRNSISENNLIRDLEIDHDNKLWLATIHGIYQFDPDTKVFTGFHPANQHPFQLLSDTILAVKKSREHQLWVGTNNGLELLDPEKGILKEYRNDPKDSNSLSSNIISVIKEDSHGNLWAGCFNGLNRLDPQTGHFKKFLRQTRIFQVFEDHEGLLWAATVKGLYLHDPATDEFVPHPDHSDMLTTYHEVYWVEEDDQQNFWINTNKGILRQNKQRTEIVLFALNQGLSALQLNNNGCTRQNGDVLFAQYFGYFTLNKSLLLQNAVKPIVLINNFLLDDVVVQPGSNSILPATLEKTKEIRLVHDQNTFSFEFSNIDFASFHEDTRLSYMLKNYDNNWRTANEGRTAYYFNLPPGQYIFTVKAFGSNGSGAEKNIAVIITPPWWKTWWAYSLYGLLLISAIWVFDRFQTQRIIRAEREKTQKKELEQAKEIEKAYRELKNTQSQLIQQEKMASLGELTAGIAHEIQNPLNFINNFSDVNSELIDEMKGELSAGNTNDAIKVADNIKENNKKIIHHGKRADGIVKGMLQHSRGSDGIKEPTDINALAEEYLRLCYHGLRAKDNLFNATLKRDFDHSIGTINIVAQDIGRVILNLYTNAFYAITEKASAYTKLSPGALAKSEASADDSGNQYEPTLSVSTKKIGNKVEIRIADNGNGIPQKVRDKIFNPFFTTKPTGQGTGLGLSLSYDIIKAHGGELKMESKEGEGAAFIIELPIK